MLLRLMQYDKLYVQLEPLDCRPAKQVSPRYHPEPSAFSRRVAQICMRHDVAYLWHQSWQCLDGCW